MTGTAEPQVAVATVNPEDQARAQLYALLAALLFRPPDQALLDALKGIEAPAGSGSGQEMAAAWGALSQAAARAEVAAIADEYQELFIGVSRGELVPYGSWYVTGFLMERPLAELRIDLKRFGFERQPGVSEPEDHAAALCETMGLIAGSADISLETQRRFFEKHLDPWMARFFRDLTTARSASFYRAVGLLGDRFLEVERTYLSMMV